MVAVKTLYQDLLNIGFSTNQAIGALANAEAESGFSEVAIGDQGTSFGLWQWHNDAYAHSILGNVGAQVAYFKQTAGSTAVGSTPEQVASNIAAQFERCQGCQVGGTQNNLREQYAAQLAQDAKTGNWPTSSGSSNSSGSSGATTTSFLSGGPFPGGPLDPLNWPTELGGAAANSLINALTGALKKIEKDAWAKLRPLLIRLGLILFGAFIVYAGINGLLKGESAGPTQITVSGAKSASKKVKS